MPPRPLALGLALAAAFAPAVPARAADIAPDQAKALIAYYKQFYAQCASAGKLTPDAETQRLLPEFDPPELLGRALARASQENGFCGPLASFVPDRDCDAVNRCANHLRDLYFKEAFVALRRSDANDDAARLAKDVEEAVAAWRLLGRQVSYADDQDHLSMDFFMRTGDAQFNPDRGATAALRRSFLNHCSGRRMRQAEFFFEALDANNGNVTMAAASASEVLQNHRGQLRCLVDVIDQAGKNYYRFAGLFVGLHGEPVRSAGMAGSACNIVGNPVVYSVAEIGGWWADVFSGKGARGGVSTADTLSKRSMYQEKLGQFNLGIEASDKLRR